MSRTEVVDAVMGTGKTNKIIQYVRESERPVLILVERQTEVDRISLALGKEIVSIAEVSEEEGVNKMTALADVAKTGLNIVSTHQLMLRWDDEFLRTVAVEGYELVIDEALTGILQVLGVQSPDIARFLTEEHLVTRKVGKTELVSVGKEDEEGNCLPLKYSNLENCIRNKSVYLYTQRNDVGKPHYRLIEAMRSDIWTHFSKIWVLTYKFSGSLLKYYLDMHNIPFKSVSLFDNEFVDYNDINGEKFKDLLTVVEGKANDFDRYQLKSGATLDGLTVTWSSDKRFAKERNNSVKKSIHNYLQTLKRTGEADLDTFAWTYHKTFLDEVYPSSVGSKKKTYACWNNKRHTLTEEERRAVTWLPQNLRGTNEWAHKTHMAYMCNTYTNGTLKMFLESTGVSIDPDTYALNQMIQWLWRGCIRNGEPMTAFVPSRRMRNLLLEWMGYEDAYSGRLKSVKVVKQNKGVTI